MAVASQTLLQASVSYPVSRLGFVEEGSATANSQRSLLPPFKHTLKGHTGLRLERSQAGYGRQELSLVSQQCRPVRCVDKPFRWRASVGAPGVADERDRESSSDLPPVPSGKMMVPMMKKGYGAYGGGATLEKSKLDLSVSKTKTVAQIDLGGGGRGNNRNISHGGGDGGDDGGDDDDYLGGDADDEGDDDNGILRKAGIIELFDRATVEAVLQEWYKTIADLPAGLRRAMEMGLISSAQLVRFISIEARPTIARAVSRLAPEGVSRALVGRMIADPAFIYKLALEQAITIGTGTWWEVQRRGNRLKDEWDLAAVNVLTLAACNAAIVWSLSPCRSYGTTAKYDWQNVIQKLPNHIFDKSYPLREFNMASRVSGFFYKAAELSLVGTVAGAVGGAVSNALVGMRKQSNPDYKPSVPVPSTGTNALAIGAFLGLSGNLRYQLLYGADRCMHQNLNSISLAILGTTVLRALNNRLGEPSRLAWLGHDVEAAGQGEPQAHAYRRPSLAELAASPKIFPFTFSIPSLESLHFLKNGVGKAEPKNQTEQRSSPQSATRRPKRKVKRKVSLAQ